VGHYDYRLKLFPSKPLSHTINTNDVDWIQAVRNLLPGGVRVAVDTVGSSKSVEQLLPLMARFGHIVSAGFMGTDDLIPLQFLRDGELSLDFVSGWTTPRMDDTLALIAAGHLQTLPLITHHFPVAQAADAWTLIESKREPVLGVILEWNSA
jgi:threonine dehydrogenase-like Zn-dependent dehydrogenase